MIPGLGRSPREGEGYPLQYSGLENSMDKVHGVAKSQTRLRDFHFTSLHSINPVGGPYVKGQPSTKIIHSLTATSTFCFSGLPAPHPHARHQADTGARLTPQCVVPSLPRSQGDSGKCEHRWGQGLGLSLLPAHACRGAGTQPCRMISPQGLPCPVNQEPLPTRAPCPGARV